MKALGLDVVIALPQHRSQPCRPVSWIIILESLSLSRITSDIYPKCSGFSKFRSQTLSSKEGSTFLSLKSSNLIQNHPFDATLQVMNSKDTESKVMKFSLRKLVFNINFNTEPSTVITSLLMVITDLLKVITDLLTVITDFLRPHGHHRI